MADNTPRKRSPSAPSIPLDEAVQRALAIYEKEQRHPAPADVVAKHIGYKSANSGSALTAIASLRSFGLLERPSPGKFAVSAEVQSYRFSPDEVLKKKLVRDWLRIPSIFAGMLDKYESGLPSDATIRYDLIQEGFQPGTAETVLKAFKRSIEFAGYYENRNVTEEKGGAPPPISEHIHHVDSPSLGFTTKANDQNVDRIPVRLDAERRAWLEIPSPFYEADKKRLKAQIDILLTDDESRNGNSQGTT